jgi:pimeloyl-ACP methyl ester carboxylesterase
MRGYARTRIGQVHYRHDGDDGPAMVCFHEAPLSSAIYAPALPVLSRSFRAWAFDTPGHGSSDPTPEPPSIDEYAAILLDAIDEIGIERFMVVGCHTGADIGLAVATHAGPSRVTHLVLSGVPLIKPDGWESYFEGVLGGQGWQGDSPQSWKDVFAPDLELSRDGAHMRWAWDRVGSRKRVDYPPDTPVELIHMAAMQLLLAGTRYNWMYKAAWSYDPEPALRALECPVLLLNAEMDPLAKTDQEVATLLRDARIVHLQGLTGQLPWRVPELFTAEIEKFVGLESGSPA